MAGQLDELRDQLKETENRALTAEKNGELMRTQRDALQTRLQETEGQAQAAQQNADLATHQRDALQSEMGALRERAQLAETNANLATSERDAMEAELKKKEEEQAPEKNGQPNPHGSNLAELPDSAPDTQFQEVRQDTQPLLGNVIFIQTQPPNPGHNAEPASFTQTLDSSVQPTGPSGK
jgi:chromosome segregation ATPase